MEQWRWITPSGNTFRLDSMIDGVEIVGEVDGRGLPPIRRTADTVPGQPGTRPRAIVHDESEIAVGLYFEGADPQGLRALLRAWTSRFDPTKGPGLLQITDPGGAVRELSCTYQDGMQLAEVAGSRSDQTAMVTFAASDPYWADAVDSTQLWTAGPAIKFYPIFPVRLGVSQVLGALDLTNLGDVDTFPVWVVTGPVAGFTLTNVTTGDALTWAGTLGAGEYITIDCRPGNQTPSPKSLRRQDGADEFAGLSTWDFWPLAPGVQTVEVEMVGAGIGSQALATWRNRFTSA